MRRYAIVVVLGVLMVQTGLFGADMKYVVVREVTGQGGTRENAIKNGLFAAVSQVRGVRVDSKDFEFGFDGAGAGIDSVQAGKTKVEFDSVSVATKGTAYTAEVRGLVKTYEVIEEERVDQDNYRVRLRVTVYDYSGGDSKRMRVALMPVKMLSGEYFFSGEPVSADNLSALFSQRLAAMLTETNKFAVLDRDSLADFAREKELLLSTDAPLSEQAKLTGTLGADYLLTSSVSEAKLERKDRYLSATGRTVAEYKARFVLNYRLIGSTSREMVFAGTARKYLENEEIRVLADEWDPAEWDAGQIRDAIIDIVVGDVVRGVLEKLYPIRVASVAGAGRVVLNQGGSKISQGMLVDVFGVGRELFDPDTGESLGPIEDIVATLRVTRVAEKLSYASLVEGDVSQISEGMVCRVRQLGRNLGTGMRPDVIRTKQGGVKLPFDK
jgi:hypothetical protein